MLPFKDLQGEPRSSRAGLSGPRRGGGTSGEGQRSLRGREGFPHLSFPSLHTRLFPLCTPRQQHPTRLRKHPLRAPTPWTLPHPRPQSLREGRAVDWSVLSCHLLLCPQGCPHRSRQGRWEQVSAFQRGPKGPGTAVRERTLTPQRPEPSYQNLQTRAGMFYPFEHTHTQYTHSHAAHPDTC